MTDFSGADDFAEGIVDTTLDTLRDQRDDQQEQTFGGEIIINPQLYGPGPYSSDANASDSRLLIKGPIFFPTPFKGRPSIELNQIPTAPAPQPGEYAVSTPVFVVIPMVYGHSYSSGAVDGFWIGCYAQTSPPSGVSVHTITWRATGTASAYLDQGTDESWTDTYDHNDADFLVDDISDQDLD